jgi:hypothetical protein
MGREPSVKYIADVELKETVPGNILETIFSP